MPFKLNHSGLSFPPWVAIHHFDIEPGRREAVRTYGIAFTPWPETYHSVHEIRRRPDP